MFGPTYHRITGKEDVIRASDPASFSKLLQLEISTLRGQGATSLHLA
jgi:hypothetical protein